MSESAKPGNGIRITQREVYDLVLEVKELIIEEREKRKSLAAMVKLQWALSASLLIAVVSVGLKALG